MARGLTSGMLAELAAGTFRPILFFQSAWGDGSTIRVWSGIGSITWNAQTWLGVGDFGSVTPNAETVDTTANGFSVSLAGCNAALVSEAIGQARRGLAGQVWLGMMDASGAVIVDPFLSCSGRLDQPEIDQNPSNVVITLAYESRLIDLERARERRFTPADQQTDYPTDKGFDFVAAIQDFTGKWGAG